MSTYSISSDNGANWITFATAGIVQCQITLRATGVDTCSLAVDPALWTSAAAYATGDTIAIKQDSTVRFVGRITEIPRQATGAQHTLSYTAEGPWARLEKITYGQTWKLRNSGGTLVDVSKPRVVLGQNDAGAQITNGAQIAAVIDYLIARGIPILKGTIDAGIIMPYDEQTMLTCADAIRTCLRWSPDWVAWWDYTTTGSGVYKPTFHCRARSNLSTATLNLTSTTKPESANLQPRADLVLPGIKIVYEKAQSYDGNNWNSYELDTAGTYSDPECVELLFQLQGITTTLLRQTLVVESYPTSGSPPSANLNDKTWWRARLPWLVDIADADLLITAGARSGSHGYASYIVDGCVPDWLTSVHVEEEVISAKVAYVRRDGDDNALEDVEEREVSVKLISTDGSSREYQTVGSINFGESTPSGVAAAIYASWSVLHYEGVFSLIEGDPSFTFVPGTKINISNGLAAWASMAALVQESYISLADGLTTVRIGPPGRLDADSLVGLYRATNARNFSWSLSARTTASVTGYDVSGTANLPKERTNDGDPGGKKRLQIRADDAEDNLQIVDINPAGTVFADEDDEDSLTIQPREVLIPELVSGVYVLKRRQVLASESYHAVVEVGLGVPPYDFQFRPTSATAADIEWGHVYVDGLITSVDNWTNYDTLANLTLSSITTSIGYYIEVDLTEGSAALISTAGDFPDGDSTTEVFPLVRITCADGVIVSWKQHQWGVIHARTSGSGSGGNLHAFKFTSTSSTGGTLEAGSLYLAGVAKTITSLPSTLSSVTSTTRYYIEVDLAAATATWTSTTSAFPASDGDTEIWPILTLTCADSVISTVKQHQTSDIHIPSNV